MPTRVLAHGTAPSCTGADLEPGVFETDVQPRGQFLIDLEFLSRYTLSGFVCVYAREPAYMEALAGLFPWLHFHVYEARQESEYDPEHAAMFSAVTAATKGNVTRWSGKLDKAMAVVYGGRERGQSLVLVCHGMSLDGQLLMHVQCKAQASLFDIADMPANYIEGELLLPMFVGRGKFLVHLVGRMYGKACVYDPSILQEEVGFAQAVLRATEAYDRECQDLILTSYAQRFCGLLGQSQIMAETLARLALEGACPA